MSGGRMRGGRAARLCLLSSLLAAVLFRTALGLHVANHVHRTKKLYDSEYFSLHKTKTMPPVDFDDQSAYETIIGTRVYKNEAIIVCFTASVVRWLVHYARMAQALGFDHFVVVGLDSQSCDAFRASWCEGVDDTDGQCSALYPGCGWFSRFGVQGSGDVSNKKVERLWLYRYHVAAELVRRGVNTLMSDLDVVLHGDFYKLLKAAPLSKYHFVQMPGDEYPNGGLWYIQNAHPRGPTVRMLEESIHMADEIIALRDQNPTFDMTSVGHHCSWVDQDVLKYTIATAVRNRSRAEWMCVPKEMDSEQEWAKAFGAGYGPKPVTWQLQDGEKHPPWADLVRSHEPREADATALAAMRFLVPPAARAGEACLGGAECARMERFERGGGAAWPAREVAIFQYPDPRPDTLAVPERLQPLPPSPAKEWILSAPTYLFNDAPLMLRGWTTHRPQPWGLVTHLVAFGWAWGTRRGGRNNRMHAIQAHGLWMAPTPTPERLLRVTQSAARAAAMQPTDGPFRQLVHAVMVAAAVTGRAPVLPAVPCEAAPWMAREPEAMHGFYDPHFITYLRDLKEPAEGDNVMCAPYLSFGEKDQCTDEAVLSEFHLDQDLLYPSFGSESVTLLGVDGGGWDGAVAELREAAKPHADVRVLFLGGDLGAVAALGKGHTPGMGLKGQEDEQTAGGMTAQQRLEWLQHICPDFFEHEPLVAKDARPDQ